MRPLVRKKDDGYQLILSFKSNGKWRQRSKQGFETEPEAWAYLPELVEIVKKSFVVDSEMENITVKDFIDIYSEHRENEVSTSTFKIMGYALNKLEPIYHKKIKNVTYYDVKSIVDNLKGTDSTNEVYFAYFKMLFNAAVKPYKLITENPTDDVTCTPKSNKKSRVKTITLAQGNKLIKEIKTLEKNSL